MGLDTVEFIIRVEETFNICLPDKELYEVQTVGELERLVISKLQAESRRRCLTQQAFYKVRREIGASLNIRLRDIRPTTILEELLPRRKRREVWQDIARRCQLVFPTLERPYWLVVLCFLTVVTSSGAIVVAVYSKSAMFLLSLFIGSLFVLGYVAGILTRPLAEAVPRTSPTVGELAVQIISLNKNFAQDVNLPAPADAYRLLAKILESEFSVPADKITRESRIVDDLGLD